jgi:hypothetical protein
LSDRSEAKISNSCMAGAIYKDVWLAGVNAVVKQDLEQPRTPLRSPWIMLQEWR